jgi:hypothetical protein
MPKDIEEFLNTSIGDPNNVEGASMEWELWGRPADLSQLLSRIASRKDSL